MAGKFEDGWVPTGMAGGEHELMVIRLFSVNSPGGTSAHLVTVGNRLGAARGIARRYYVGTTGGCE